VDRQKHVSWDACAVLHGPWCPDAARLRPAIMVADVGANLACTSKVRHGESHFAVNTLHDRFGWLPPVFGTLRYKRRSTRKRVEPGKGRLARHFTN